jgi:8-oxo-dGTP diphosphatase
MKITLFSFFFSIEYSFQFLKYSLILIHGNTFQNYRAMVFIYSLVHHFKVIKMNHAVDGILFDGQSIILIRRKGRTFNNYWALPGGFVEEGECVEETLVREMKEETGLSVKPKAILGVYSAPERDPRGQTISTVFVCDYHGNIKAGDDAKDAKYFSLEEVDSLKLAFDHHQIINGFKHWLVTKETFWSQKSIQ